MITDTVGHIHADRQEIAEAQANDLTCYARQEDDALQFCLAKEPRADGDHAYAKAADFMLMEKHAVLEVQIP